MSVSLFLKGNPPSSRKIRLNIERRCNMEVNFTQIGKRIAEIRKGQHISQMELAEMVDLSISYISHIETAKKKPSIESLIKIVNALNITMDELLCGNQLYDPNTYQTDIDLLMADCTITERYFLYRMLQSAKEILRDYQRNTPDKKQ
jgi:transcriptional regulator with XRE-family HTH domain